MDQVQKITGYSSLQMTRQRELGQIFKQDTLTSKYYRHIKPVSSWTTDYDVKDHGSIFNLEFSPSGQMMVAVSEKGSIMLFDPLLQTLLSKRPQAHSDSVNCICFLDDRTFVTGSDDCSMALWDARMLRDKVLQLEGHTSWVKSIAYNRKTHQLVSAAFDNTVRVWDINKYTDSRPNSKVVLTVEHLTRMQLSPGTDQMIISALGGSLTVYHNLDLASLQGDVNKHMEHHSISCDRNHMESIVDFPLPPWCISSLQVHPYGWCLLSRYFSRQQRLEYTTVHDIQTMAQGHPPNTRQERLSLYYNKLTYFKEESYAAQGFIKEQHFSKDGRVIASPFANGTRLLAFSSDCSELSKCDPGNPVMKELHEIKYLLSHRHPVCTCRFSPSHMLIASGCLGGKIRFHEPKLS